MLILYRNKIFYHTNKVEYVLKLLGLDYEYKKMDFKDLKSRDYLKLHPAGKIPVIDDEGFILFESNAISKYLCNKVESELYPANLQERAIIDQWIDIASIHLDNATSDIAFYRLLAKSMNVEISENAINEGLKALDRFLPILNSQLEKNRYLASDELTLADINLLSILEYAESSKIDLSKYKSLKKWLEELQNMEFFKQIHK